MIRNWYASDERFHGELKRQAEEELSWPGAVERMQQTSGEYRQVEWQLANDESENPQSTIHNPQSDGAQVLDARSPGDSARKKPEGLQPRARLARRRLDGVKGRSLKNVRLVSVALSCTSTRG
jgi:hypothetical protein